MKKNLITQIAAAYPEMTFTNRKIAHYILENRSEVQFLSITALAEKCFVAVATITRFCRQLGFDGYNQFKIELAVSNNQRDNVISKEISVDENSTYKLAQDIYENETLALRETMNLLKIDDIKIAVEMLKNANHVFCFGNGGGLIVAMVAWSRFICISPKFICIQDNHFQTLSSSLMNENDVILFFSYSGDTKDAMALLPIAKKNGVKIILITHYAKSPSGKYSDMVLLCGSDENPLQNGSMAAKVGYIFIADILYNEYCNSISALKDDINRRIAEAISSKLL